MSKEIAKKLIAELQTNEELKSRINGVTEPAELVKIAVEAGYDVTLEELIEAEKEYRQALAQKNDELSADELESAAGGMGNDIARDGHEHRCMACYHGSGYERENNDWCKSEAVCLDNYYKEQAPENPFKDSEPMDI